MITDDVSEAEIGAVVVQKRRKKWKKVTLSLLEGYLLRKSCHIFYTSINNFVIQIMT